MPQLPRNHWDQDLRDINRNYKEQDAEYVGHLRSFQLIFTKVQTIVGNIEPSIKLYRKPQRVGSIHHSSQSTTPFKLNIYAYVDITEKLTSVDFDEYAGHVRMTGDVNKKWLNYDKYLNQELFYSWMESAVQRTLSELTRTFCNISVLRKKTPALLFSIIEDNKNELNINIIPAVVFDHSRGECFAIVDRNYFRYKQSHEQTMMNSIPSDSWRVAFPKEEQHILRKNEHLKTTMRYIKLIRDSYKLKYIPNYCIKMMFLLKHKEENGFWNSSLTNLLVEMVYFFYECMSECRLCDTWDMRYNLLNEFEIKPTQANDCCNRLKNIIRRINDRDDNIESILFNTSLNELRAHSSNLNVHRLHTVSPTTTYLYSRRSISPTSRNGSSMMTTNQRNEEQSNFNSILVAGGAAVVAVGAAALLVSLLTKPNRNQN